MPGKALFYIAYAFIVCASFALTGQYPSNATIAALPANFLSGFVVVAFVDNLLRLAEARRRRPMDVIVQKNNSVARCRLKSVFTTAMLAAEASGHIRPGQYDLGVGLDVPESLINAISMVPLNLSVPHRGALLRNLAHDVASTQETLTRSLDQYGSYQDPETAALLADVAHSELFGVIDQLHRSGHAGNVVLPPELWAPGAPGT